MRPKAFVGTRRWNGDHDDRPVEYVVLKFPDGHMNEDVADEILWLSIMHVIRLLDFVLVTKNDVDMVSVVELNELSQMGGFSDIEGQMEGLIDQQDIELVSAWLEEESAAALMIFEDLWATSLSQALNRSGGLFLERSRVIVPKASSTYRRGLTTSTSGSVVASG